MEEMLRVRRKLLQWRIGHDTLTITRFDCIPHFLSFARSLTICFLCSYFAPRCLLIFRPVICDCRLPMAPCMTRTHAMCVVNDGLLVFGGCLSSNGVDSHVAHGISADVWIYFYLKRSIFIKNILIYPFLDRNGIKS